MSRDSVPMIQRCAAGQAGKQERCVCGELVPAHTMFWHRRYIEHTPMAVRGGDLPDRRVMDKFEAAVRA